jgi:hypothetical protein
MVAGYLSNIFELGTLCNDCGVNLEVDVGILELEAWWRESGDLGS